MKKEELLFQEYEQELNNLLKKHEIYFKENNLDFKTVCRKKTYNILVTFFGWLY